MREIALTDEVPLGCVIRIRFCCSGNARRTTTISQERRVTMIVTRTDSNVVAMKATSVALGGRGGGVREPRSIP